MNASEITLQINLSPGDIAYAQLTVPVLVELHKNIPNRLLIVDCCRPQKTKIFDPDKKIPLEVFNQRLERLLQIVEELRESCSFTEVLFLYPHNKALFRQLSAKYLYNLYTCTHSAGGTANMSYWAAIEFPKTKYVLHYDGDIILYQKSGFDWVTEAISFMERDKTVVAAVPRLTPPHELITSNLLHIKAESSAYWLDDWFSTRHFLLDKSRLEAYLPLVQGKIKWELLLRKWLNRAFPRDPEILLYKSVGEKQGRRLVLKNEGAFLLHPALKNAHFIELLPRIIESVKSGIVPDIQRGKEDLDLEAWGAFLKVQG